LRQLFKISIAEIDNLIEIFEDALNFNYSPNLFNVHFIHTMTQTVPGQNPLHDAPPKWRVAEVEALFAMPFNDLIYRAQRTHRQHFDANAVQLSTLLSIKTGGCPEDCAYCPQAARYHTGVENQETLPLDAVVAAARAAKEEGATRFCMGAAWRGPKQKDLDQVIEMVRAVRALGLETCATLGLLKEGQAEQLREAGLDYYNHNLDSSADYYGEIISTRDYQDRLDTLSRVRGAGIHVCCGGIVGMGETRRQRAALIAQLANLDPYPESVPINNLVQIEGTPLYGTEKLDPLEFVRTIAVARITMPKAMVRLSAGREAMPEELQALCFLAGANSIFYGEKLLTTGNPQTQQDRALLDKLGMRPM
jgi:biotin synthase